MSVRLILGRAGTGKTHRCLAEIQSESQGAPFGPPLILLVPEQATFQMEQELIRTGVRGSARARVLSFQRLAHLVFSEVGGSARPHLSDVGRKMLLRSLIYRRRQDLRLYHHVAGETGFTERLSRTFSEFRMHGYTPDDLLRASDSAAAKSAPLLQKKLRDLSVLYRDYTTHIADRYADPDSVLGDAAAAVPRSQLLCGAQVWIDGFAGFTPQEFRMLHALFKAAARVHVTLCLDPDEFLSRSSASSDQERTAPTLFRLPHETAQELLGIARQVQVPVEEPLLLRGREGMPSRFRDPSLRYLENAWDKPSAPAFDHEANSVIVRTAEDRITEVEAVAGEIHRLVRQGGYRYKEISIIVRSLDTYAPHIAAVFARLGIPYFVDRRRDMLFHPLVQAVTASLEAIESRWHSEPIIRFLKTDFAPLARERVDLLENYVLEHGITGRAWVDERPWSFGRNLWRDEDDDHLTEGAYGGSPNIDADRRLAMAALKRLAEAIGRGTTFTPEQAAAALWTFLTDLSADQRIAQWIDEARAAGDPEMVLLHTQVWNAVIGILDEMSDALPAEPMDLGELVAMLEEGFQSLRLGLIPPKLDQVLVGAIDRSRQPDVRAVFVMGLVDREFPAVPQEDAVLTDSEREALNDGGLPLGETSRARMELEQFYGYIAVTRASEELHLSAPLSDGRGRALLPSSIVGRVKRLLPRVRTEMVRRFHSHDLSRVVTLQQAAGYVVRGLRTEPSDPKVLDVYEWLVTHPEYGANIRPTLRSLVHSNAVAPLPLDLSTTLYGDPLITSISRLERFAACPFQHFAFYGLGLQERTVLRLDPSRLGVLTHSVLKAYVDHVMEHGIDWHTLPDEEAYALVDQMTEAAARELVGEVLLSSGRQRYLIDLARRTLRTAVRLLNEHMRVGQFRPIATELSFGRTGDQVSGWRLPLPGGGQVHLVGVIDRLDMCRLNGTSYVRVVDYKSYERKVVWSDMLQGLELQLIVYLGVAADHLGAAPAGAFYQPVRDPFIQAEADLDSDRAWALRKAKLKASGLLCSDDDGQVALAMDGSVGPSSSSTLLPFGLKKDGTFNAYSSVASQQDLELLIDSVRTVVTGLAERIRSGDHDVRPFRRKDSTRACTWCPYHAVCRFDVLLDGNAYRYLESYKQDELWKRVRHGDEPVETVS